MLVTYERYVEITGDTTTASATVEARLVDAQGLLEDTLGRPLETGERTERMRIYNVDGVATVYPSAVPVTDAGDYTQVGDGLVGATPIGGVAFGVPQGHAEVVYTGGFDPDETDPDEPAYLPRSIERDIAWAAHALTHHPSSQIPAGATSVRLGDAAVTYAKPTSGGSPVSWSPATLRWRRRLP